MVIAENPAFGCEDLAENRLGFGIPPHGVQQDAEVGHRRHGLGILRTLDPTETIEGLPVVGLGLGEAAGFRDHLTEISDGHQGVPVIIAENATHSLEAPR